MRFRYRTFEFGEQDVHVRTLRDRQEFDAGSSAHALGLSPALWPIFGVVWDSGQILARLMADRSVLGLRILEVGCGIGLASLVLNGRAADITATDVNPDAGAFLALNTTLNAGAAIPFLRTAWADAVTDLGSFDLIIGSDLLYDPGDVEALAAFIDQHARPTAEVVIVDPGRGLHARFGRSMADLGFTPEAAAVVGLEGLDAPFRGKVLVFRRLGAAT